MDRFGLLLSQQGWHLLRPNLLSEEWIEIGLRTDVIEPMEMGGVSSYKLEPIAAWQKCADLSGIPAQRKKSGSSLAVVDTGCPFSCSIVCTFFSEIFCCRGELGPFRPGQSCSGASSGGGEVIVAWFILYSFDTYFHRYPVCLTSIQFLQLLPKGQHWCGCHVR